MPEMIPQNRGSKDLFAEIDKEADVIQIMITHLWKNFSYLSTTNAYLNCAHIELIEQNS